MLHLLLQAVMRTTETLEKHAEILMFIATVVGGAKRDFVDALLALENPPDVSDARRQLMSLDMRQLAVRFEKAIQDMAV